MLTLYSYPDLFGVADNNPFGLKTYAFLKLSGLPFQHQHIFDASKAPRGQLPYLQDGDRTVGDSDTIIAYLIERYALPIDDGLTARQRDTQVLVMRMLDDLYWVMSYSRWKDPRFWPQFRDAILSSQPSVSLQAMEAAQQFNFQRYHYQGIGRYEPEQAYARGLADLGVLANLIPAGAFAFGLRPTSIDAAIYGFIANIFYYPIDTPLKAFVQSAPNLVTHCTAIHAAIADQPDEPDQPRQPGDPQAHPQAV